MSLTVSRLANHLGEMGLMTIGRRGKFSTLQDALAVRATIPHTPLTSFTGSITGTSGGTVDVRRIVADSGTPLSSYTNKRIVGCRIGGSGNPIVRARVFSSSVLELMYPAPADFTSANIEVFEIVPVAIALLPGTLLSITDRYLIIPAFTTISALVPYTATIRKEGGSGTSDVLFYTDNAQNEIFFDGLVLEDARRASGSRFWQVPAHDSTDSLLQILCDFGIRNCILNTSSQDMIYVAKGLFAASGIGGRLAITGCQFTGGGFDVIFAGDMRHLFVCDNKFDLHSHSESQDGGDPCAVALSSSSVTNYQYLLQQHNIWNNNIICRARASNGAGDSSEAAGVDIRGPLSSPAKVLISHNNIRLRKDDGSEHIFGVRYGGGVAGRTPRVQVSNNIFDCVVAGGTGTAYTMHSMDVMENVNILRHSNTVINGTLGTRTTSIAGALV